MSARPSKSVLDRAVRLFQLYCGSASTTSMRVQQRLYDRAQAAARRIAAKTGADAGDVGRQLGDEARRRGCITPMPGKDI